MTGSTLPNFHALNVFDAPPERAADVLAVIRRSFGARPVLDPPSTALTESVESVREALAEGGGLLVERRGKPIGAMLYDTSRPGLLGFRRVSVDPDHQDRGVASAMVGVAEDTAEERGLDGVWLDVREELPENVTFWTRRRYFPVRQHGTTIEFGKTLWLARELPTAEDAHAFGVRLASLLQAGDVVVMSGGLGAGKTTLTQGIGEGLGVRGPVTSPTFVLARTHPNLAGGPPLVHVDAYRLGAALELDDLDLDTATEDSVTVVEWGTGMAEDLSDSWLEVRLERRAATVLDPLGAEAPERADVDDHDVRLVTVKPHGVRWARVPLRSTLLGPGAVAHSAQARGLEEPRPL
ncbi:tRNA (adenosine(37)-N6)-threonylcarbamoyltransferase complex ATPase subunit type 1 TsaE [Mumia sp. zg.B17]|uniref:tRNA (adenosine(37)-N6)-threonylcarbamoyltransferase complex ATPase subunit type 1 TsaE n=1 Tax=Mumia sp. zg.B17 TaxID=2855446 RepID=UPI001C6E529A|nr:tRNA (adenosine(37)-N6)-threonylcarbamoyltransferase complex ATPase subunit type 1 TsaE [Mumia sp. zg.B17]MBW9204729.1 tRNA (adenosine(37)-N6)-threonylcarbamoyltransferase complex ATPase subunit type 1 TsaE [Mumia sp. zg.B17]